MKALRWILFFPAAVIAAYIGSLLFKTMDRIPFISHFLADDSLFYKIFDYPIGGITSGALFILIGTVIAPSNKKAVSLILLIVICLVSIMSTWGVIKGGVERDYWLIVFAFFMTLSALVTHLNFSSIFEEDSN